MLLLKVILRDVPSRPSCRGPEALRFSSTAQVIEQWVYDDIVRLGTIGRDAVRFPAAAPGLLCITRTDTNVLQKDVVGGDKDPPRMSVMPGDGEVCPATVTNGSSMVNVRWARSITPPTSNTTMRGPWACSAACSEPGPSASRLVTVSTRPPCPPSVVGRENVGSGGPAGGSGFAQAAMTRVIRKTMLRTGFRSVSIGTVLCLFKVY
jgi:hypothetical protein